MMSKANALVTKKSIKGRTQKNGKVQAGWCVSPEVDRAIRILAAEKNRTMSEVVEIILADHLDIQKP